MRSDKLNRLSDSLELLVATLIVIALNSKARAANANNLCATNCQAKLLPTVEHLTFEHQTKLPISVVKDYETTCGKTCIGVKNGACSTSARRKQHTNQQSYLIAKIFTGS